MKLTDLPPLQQMQHLDVEEAYEQAKSYQRILRMWESIKATDEFIKKYEDEMKERDVIHQKPPSRKRMIMVEEATEASTNAYLVNQKSPAKKRKIIMVEEASEASTNAYLIKKRSK